MFGSKKVFAKVQNGKLIVRVGGGWVSMEEFIKHYWDETKEITASDGRKSLTMKHLARQVGERKPRMSVMTKDRDSLIADVKQTLS